MKETIKRIDVLTWYDDSKKRHEDVHVTYCSGCKRSYYDSTLPVSVTMYLIEAPMLGTVYGANGVKLEKYAKHH